jgi:hypothetical protein
MTPIGPRALIGLVVCVMTFVPPVVLRTSRADGAVPFFTRQVERCTGGGGLDHAGVVGQDSAIIVPYGDEVRLFFGDTSVSRDGGTVWLPNSMASTSALDAREGLTLQYYLPDHAMPVLRQVGAEATVWLSAAFVHRKDLYAYYTSIAPGWPSTPPLGSGLAVMRDGIPPFVRTGLYVFPDDQVYLTGIGHALVEGEYVYVFGRMPNGLESKATLKRVPLDAVERREAYEFWTTNGWAVTPDPPAVLFEEAGEPAVHWSDYHQQYLGLYSMLYSPFGFLSAVAFRTAPALTGPWSEPTILNGAPGTGWGSNYGADWDPIFSRENGRVIYFTSTDWSAYNVFLYETSFEFARGLMRTRVGEDFASEVRCDRDPACRRPRVGRRSLPLRREEKTIAAVRLVGAAFFPVSPAAAVQVTLPIRPVRRGPLTLTLRIAVEPPNRPSFDRRVPGDLELRSRLASIEKSVTLPVGATEITLGDEIAPLVDAVTSHPDWVPAQSNSFSLLVTRTDSVPATIHLDTAGPMGAGYASLCFGWCTTAAARALETTPAPCGG